MPAAVRTPRSPSTFGRPRPGGGASTNVSGVRGERQAARHLAPLGQVVLKPVVGVPRIDGSGHVPDLGVLVRPLLTQLPGIMTPDGRVNALVEVKVQDRDGSVKQKIVQSILDLGRLTAQLPVVGVLVHDMAPGVITAAHADLWDELARMNAVVSLTMEQAADTDLVRAALAAAARDKAGRMSHRELAELAQALGSVAIGQLLQHQLALAVLGASPYEVTSPR